MAKIQLIGPSYSSEFTNASTQELINFYLETATGVENQDWAAVPTPGLFPIIQDSSISGRARPGGSISISNIALVVISNSVYKFTLPGSLVKVGEVGTDVGPVQMAAIEGEVVIVDGEEGYSYKISSGNFSRITDQDFPMKPISVSATNDYFICVEGGTQLFYTSALADGRSWSSLDFAASDVEYDLLKHTVVENSRVWFLGEYTTEIWRNTGNALGAPFDRISYGAIQVGVVAPSSVQSIGESVIFLAQDKTGMLGVVTCTASGIENINSTVPMLQEMNKYVNIDNAYSSVFKFKGHTFYSITFPQALSRVEGTTWLLDLSTNSWSKWSSYEDRPGYGFYTQHKSCNIFTLGYRVFCCDYLDSTIWEISPSIHTEGSHLIRRCIVSRHITSGNRRFRISSVEVDYDVMSENSNVSGNTEDYISLSVSRDRGKTFGNMLHRSVGKIGEVLKRAVWTRLGVSTWFTFKLEFMSTRPICILGMWADPERQEEELRGGRE